MDLGKRIRFIRTATDCNAWTSIMWSRLQGEWSAVLFESICSQLTITRQRTCSRMCKKSVPHRQTSSAPFETQFKLVAMCMWTLLLTMTTSSQTRTALGFPTILCTNKQTNNRANNPRKNHIVMLLINRTAFRHKLSTSPKHKQTPSHQHYRSIHSIKKKKLSMSNEALFARWLCSTSVYLPSHFHGIYT